MRGPTEERADERAAELLAAARAGDWATAADVVDGYWVDLTMYGHLDAVGRVIASMPTENLLDPPTAGLIAENIGRLEPGTVRYTLPEDPDALGELGRSPRAASVISRSLAAMTARRRRGEHRDAMEFVRRGAVLARAAEFVGFRAVDEVLPFWHLQAGITAFLADDMAEARRLHRAAYRDRANSRYDIVARDSAGNLAMIEALAGNLLEADVWLRRAESEGHGPVWVGELINTPIRVASGLVAMDRLDAEGYEPFIDHFATAIDHDEHWPGLLVARVAMDLSFADVAGAQATLDAVLVSHEKWLGIGGIGERFLVRAGADLAMARGHAVRARKILTSAEDIAAPVQRARLALLTGEAEEARALVAGHEGSPEVTLRERIELQLIGACADDAAGVPEQARRRLAEVLLLAGRHGNRRCFTTVPRAFLQAYADQLPELVEVLDFLDGLSVRTIYPDRLDEVTLTAREQAVLEQLPGPRTLDEIASDAFVTTNTIKSQMRSLREKLGARSRREVVARARSLGLLDD